MSEPDPSKSEKNTAPRWTTGAVAVFVLGLVILIPSGLCTGVIVLPVGGLPMVIGAALVYAGLKLRRRD